LTDQEKTPPYIDIDAFLSASGSSDRVGYTQVLKLFDRQRKVGFVERLLVPKWLKENVMDAAQKAKDSQQASNDEDSVMSLVSTKIMSGMALSAKTTRAKKQADEEAADAEEATKLEDNEATKKQIASCPLQVQKDFISSAVCAAHKLDRDFKQVLDEQHELDRSLRECDHHFREQGYAFQQQLVDLSACAQKAHTLTQERAQLCQAAESLRPPTQELAPGEQTRAELITPLICSTSLPSQTAATGETMPDPLARRVPLCKLRRVVLALTPQTGLTSEQIDTFIDEGKKKAGINSCQCDLSLREISSLLLALDSLTQTTATS